MVVVIGEARAESNVDADAFRVFIKSIELLGGPRRLVEYRNLTWVPSLMAASYAVVLHEKGRTADEIAKFLGLSSATVERILGADPDTVMHKLSGEDVDDHVAGGLAKEAYRRLRAGEDLGISMDSSRRVLDAVGGPAWALAVLTSIKGIDFPVNSPEDIEDRLRGIEVNGKPAEQLLRKIRYPLRSPAELLHALKKASEEGNV